MDDFGSFVTTSILGVIYLGVAFSCVLYGFTCLQTFYYFRTFKHDKRRLLALVALVWALDTAHQVLVIDAGYVIIISDYGNIDRILEFELDWNLITTLIINGILVSIVDLFFLQRLWNLSSKKWYPSIIGVLILLHFGIAYSDELRSDLRMTAHMVAGLYITYTVDHGEFKISSSSASFGFVSSNILLLASFCTDFVMDLMLCVGLVRYLRQGKRGFPGSGDFISRFIIMTISTGVLTTFMALANIIALIFAGFAPGLFYLFNFIIGKIYVNALLTTLNAREGLRARLNSHAAAESLTAEHELEALARRPTLESVHNEHYPIFSTTGTAGSVKAETHGAKWEDDAL